MKKILIVDDAPTVRQQISLTLEKEEYTVLEAENGQLGIEMVEKHPDIDLILCDYNMPGMNGFEMIEELNKRNIKIPTMMLTTEVGKQYVQKGKELGLKGWIVKPFDPDKLIKIAQKLTSS